MSNDWATDYSDSSDSSDSSIISNTFGSLFLYRMNRKRRFKSSKISIDRKTRRSLLDFVRTKEASTAVAYTFDGEHRVIFELVHEHARGWILTNSVHSRYVSVAWTFRRHPDDSF